MGLNDLVINTKYEDFSPVCYKDKFKLDKIVVLMNKYPVNGCVDGVKCLETEHQFNRRTEFKILNCNF